MKGNYMYQRKLLYQQKRKRDYYLNWNNCEFQRESFSPLVSFFPLRNAISKHSKKNVKSRSLLLNYFHHFYHFIPSWYAVLVPMLLYYSFCFFAAVTFGYPNQPKLFINLDFGIDMKSRSKRKFFFCVICFIFSPAISVVFCEGDTCIFNC